MIEIATLLAALPPVPGASAAVPAPVTGNVPGAVPASFALTLADFLDRAAPPPSVLAPPIALPTSPDDRQADATDGNDLPLDDEQVPPASAWLSIPLPAAIATPASSPAATAPPLASQPIAPRPILASTVPVATVPEAAAPPKMAPSSAAAVVPAKAAPNEGPPVRDRSSSAVFAPVATPSPIAPSPTESPSPVIATASAPGPALPPPATDAATNIAALPTKTAAPPVATGNNPALFITAPTEPAARADVAPVAQPNIVSVAAATPAETPALPSLIQPAARAFAAAIAAASPRTPPLRADARDSIAETIFAGLDTGAVGPSIVQPTADARHPVLDLRQDQGLRGMIDRIELLRDDADARDTRIRLVPDALGGVDIAVRKQGDTLHVHFTADTRATATLLTEAQPRLAELAEARGVKLGQTSVDTGHGNAPRQQQQAARQQPAVPARATPKPETSKPDHLIA